MLGLHAHNIHYTSTLHNNNTMEVVPSQYGSNRCAISFCHLKLKNAKFKYCYHITFLQIQYHFDN